VAKNRSNKASFKDYLHHIHELGATKSPLIGLFGSSEFLIEAALDAIRSRAKEDSAEITFIEGGSLNEEKLEALVRQTSLFEPVTYYIVRRAEQAKTLSKILKNIFPQKPHQNSPHRLIFVWSGVDPTAAVATELKRLQTFMVPCMEPWPNEMPQVIQMYATALGLKMRSDAVYALIEANGTDLIKHRHELNKIAFIKHNIEAPLSKEDLVPLLGILREDDAFHLDRLLIQENWEGAQALLDSLLDRGEKALGILSILSNHCRNILKIHNAISQGFPPSALSQETRLPTFILKNYLPMAGRANTLRYIRAIEMCNKADISLKSQPTDESILLGRIIQTLAQ
jgi:DNA polymerase III delta subunit